MHIIGRGCQRSNTKSQHPKVQFELATLVVAGDGSPADAIQSVSSSMHLPVVPHPGNQSLCYSPTSGDGSG